MGQVLHRHTTHITRHTAHVAQSAADSHTWDKYIKDTHSPHDAVRSRLSHMGQVNYITWLVIQSAPDSQAWDQYITDTQPMWYSLQRTLTHWTSTSHSPCGTVHSTLSCMQHVYHTAYVVQSATDSHTWDKYVTDIQPMWYVYNINLHHRQQILLKLCTSRVFSIAYPPDPSHQNCFLGGNLRWDRLRLWWWISSMIAHLTNVLGRPPSMGDPLTLSAATY